MTLQRQEVLHYGSMTRRLDMLFESAARLAKQLAQLGGTRGDWFRVVMEKFIVNFRLETWLQHADPQQIGTKLVPSTSFVPLKPLEFPLGKSKKHVLFSEVVAQLASPKNTVTSVYLLNGKVDYIYFPAFLQASHQAKKNKRRRVVVVGATGGGKEEENTSITVFKLCVLQSNEPPRGVSVTEITSADLKVHDPSNVSGFVWSRAIIFDGQIFGERWEHGHVCIHSNLYGIASQRQRGHQRDRRSSSSHK